MDYLLSTLEGIITFISPCMLPMLPIYVSYFAGGGGGRKRALVNSLGFVLGFSAVFILLGAFAGTVGRLLRDYAVQINLVAGAIVVLFGLNFIGILKIPFINATKKIGFNPGKTGFLPSILFGIIFSIGWSPCVGAFLGSALMLAASSGSVLKGIVMLAFYSLGLGIPFVVSAWILDSIKGTFDFIKRNYAIINIASGIFLVIVGIAMMTGMLNRLLALLS
jgi:cytochrome c-type biogenesis protein